MTLYASNKDIPWFNPCTMIKFRKLTEYYYLMCLKAVLYSNYFSQTQGHIGLHIAFNCHVSLISLSLKYVSLGSGQEKLSFLSLEEPQTSPNHILSRFLLIPLLAFHSKGAKVQLSLVVPYPDSSDTSRLHLATEVRPQQDQSHLPEVHWWGSRGPICPGDQLPGPFSKKGW